MAAVTLSQTKQLKWHIYYLTVLEVKSLTQVLMHHHAGVDEAASGGSRGEHLSLPFQVLGPPLFLGWWQESRPFHLTSSDTPFVIMSFPDFECSWEIFSL
jgi:hypothetical protein